MNSREDIKKNTTKEIKKEVNKQFLFCVIAILTLIVIVFIFNYCTTFGNYKRQSLEILNKYKSGQLTRKEAIEKINTIIEKIENDDNTENNAIFYLKIQLESIIYDFKDGEVGNTEVNIHIQKIKEIKNYFNIL